jgi:transcription factor IIIB 90 kDa subunit
VVAAAMYIICRQEKTAHLLIDFSDVLQINLYTLGSCYLKLIKFLHFDMPAIDPSLFIHRFCAKLEFGDMLPKVSMTALRLVSRMKRDWMCHGRRPTGLVGAAIIIAARFHGFKRTNAQIVSTVHVCDETIRKRLAEFKQTPIARLTREEFEKLDLENDIKEECDPPSFKKTDSMEVLRIASYEKELEKKAKQIENAITKIEDPPEPLPPGHLPLRGHNLESNTQASEIGQTLSETNLNNSTQTELLQQKILTLEEQDALEEAAIDDEEIEKYILSKEESAIKSILWHRMHKDWLDEQEMKEKKKQKGGVANKRRKKNKECSELF